MRMRPTLLVFGGSGFVGQHMRTRYGREYNVVCPTRQACDITDGKAVAGFLASVRPDIVIHCAQLAPSVKGCEEYPEKAELINVQGTANITQAAKRMGARLVFFSTDYVFDGKPEGSYKEDDNRSSQTVYGKTKIKAEDAALELAKSNVVRTSVIFGAEKGVVADLNRLSPPSTIKACTDKVRCPTYVEDLVNAIGLLLMSDRFGVYHIVNGGSCSNYDFALTAARMSGKPDEAIVPSYLANEPYGSIVPSRLVLSTDKWQREGFSPLRSYSEALAECLASCR